MHEWCFTTHKIILYYQLTLFEYSPTTQNNTLIIIGLRPVACSATNPRWMTIKIGCEAPSMDNNIIVLLLNALMPTTFLKAAGIC